jgi:hypothetical protein
MFVDLAGYDYIPHIFLVITRDDGTYDEYGLSPQDHSKQSTYGLSGSGKIDVKLGIKKDNLHESQFQSKTVELTDTQYQKLMGYRTCC